MKVSKGQVAVITGGASGIGFELAQRGLRIMLADVESRALKSAEHQLVQDGFEVGSELTDVTDYAASEHLAQATVRRFGGVNILINNAGVGSGLGPIWASDTRDWNWTFGVNLFGVVHGLQAMVPRMLALGEGHVVNVASLAGLVSVPFNSAYAASKHAVVVLSESLAGEFAALGLPIKVSVVCPGFVATRIFESERNRPDHLRAAARTPPELAERLRAAFAERVWNNPKSPTEAASRIVAGIERDDFYILTHQEQNAAVLSRLAAVESAVRSSCPTS
ncbi:SDR family NAD(P)-dependent oxidoreductase [Bradyrhizobium sp. Ec3.3]|uniref:SDR family NAD(P)-dependent oxidoreductase n=1 Tax=Bradyrhizobium sp. Ec3.3 TaxID=189753 RepID=UPI0003FF9880|nr:SDR family NAD(P)-dependent oxidoreductase [Bradyrhizobium sp. Ec3.3]